MVYQHKGGFDVLLTKEEKETLRNTSNVLKAIYSTMGELNCSYLTYSCYNEKEDIVVEDVLSTAVMLDNILLVHEMS